MRVLVYPHAMEIGGSQLNAIEIAAQVSAAQARGGVPIQQPIEVREVMEAPRSDG